MEDTNLTLREKHYLSELTTALRSLVRTAQLVSPLGHHTGKVSPAYAEDAKNVGKKTQNDLSEIAKGANNEGLLTMFYFAQMWGTILQVELTRRSDGQAQQDPTDTVTNQEDVQGTTETGLEAVSG